LNGGKEGERERAKEGVLQSSDARAAALIPGLRSEPIHQAQPPRAARFDLAGFVRPPLFGSAFCCSLCSLYLCATRSCNGLITIERMLCGLHTFWSTKLGVCGVRTPLLCGAEEHGRLQHMRGPSSRRIPSHVAAPVAVPSPTDPARARA
jgi:hypothetical protein